MLAPFRPSTIPDYPVTYPRFNPREGMPFIEKDNTHWYVKIYLPDVSKNNVSAEIIDKKLLITRKNEIQINHDGRIFASKELFERTIELVDGITMNDIGIHWSDNIIVFSILKPVGL